MVQIKVFINSKIIIIICHKLLKYKSLLINRNKMTTFDSDSDSEYYVNSESETSSDIVEYLDSDLQHTSQMVLCIEEMDGRPGKEKDVDTRVFIVFDYECGGWHILGKRTDTRSISSVPFKFLSFSPEDIWTFMELIIGKAFMPMPSRNSFENCSISIYNFNNLNECEDLDDLTYEFFEENMDKSYEIAAYDEVSLSKRYIVRVLEMMEKFYNVEQI
uniref:Uncharacterized protein n=1 Tax=viral metagenome TaxID=1070528 RepID=A0A6C0IWN8_9ZZZZ